MNKWSNPHVQLLINIIIIIIILNNINNYNIKYYDYNPYNNYINSYIRIRITNLIISVMLKLNLKLL